MNKNECKKYIKKAFNNIKAQNKSITINNLENEMLNLINEDRELYIAYGKMALYTLLNSASFITDKDLEKEVDVLKIIYKDNKILEKASNLN